MKKFILLIVALISMAEAYSQTYIAETIPWFSGKSFRFSGHTSSNIDYDETVRKFRYRDNDWHNFSSIIHGDGKIYFATSQTWQTPPPGMDTNRMFDPQTYVDNFTRMIIDYEGNVGIGTSNPGAVLEVKKSSNPNFSLVNGANNKLEIGVANCNGCYATYAKSGDAVMRTLGGGDQIFDIPSSTDNNRKIIFGSSLAREIMVIKVNGNVGVGTTNPDEKLTVKGKIHAEEVRIDLNVPADYVFQKYYTGNSSLKDSYTMPSLEEVEAFTKKNHHLPEIPSAEEIQKNGLHLKEMTNLLLQKIEELTLYLIQQNKEIHTLKKQVAQLQQ